jgi:hypothetical protein
MIATNRMVMRDRPTGGDQCVARRVLERLPLFQQCAVLPECVE